MTPTTALLWGLWRQHRWTAAAIAMLTSGGYAAHFSKTDAAADPEPLTVMLGMMAFLLLLGIFNYTEAADERGLGEFPRRLYTLPVTSLRLVTVPLLAAIASIELLYLLWMVPMARGGSIFSPFVALLLAVLVVFYLSALWSLDRAGALRLIVLGAIVLAMFAISMLPSFPPTPPPIWRSEIFLAAMLGAFAVMAFLWSWRLVAQRRSGGGYRPPLRAETIVARVSEAGHSRKHPFRDLSTAQFWFEWRSSGLVLPATVAGVLLLIVLPLSLTRTDQGTTFWLLLIALATPIVLAVPIGLAFSKPAFWTEDLGVPAFIAVRPISAEELVAAKVRIAAISALCSWLLVVGFVAVWMSLWGRHDTVSNLGLQLWAFHGQSMAALIAVVSFVVFSGIALTWRLLVSRLWSGLSGIRWLLLGAVTSLILVAIIALGSDATEFPRWLFDDPGRLSLPVRLASAAVIVKYWLAVYTWRRVPARYLIAYCTLWLPATLSLLAFGLTIWNVVRIYAPVDADRLLSLIVLVVLLAVPLARVGLAREMLARNRHRT